MKKIIGLIALTLCMAISGYAQSPNGSFTGSTVPYVTTSDVVTNTGADTFKYKAVGYMRSVTFQVNITKTSGTLGGTVKVFGSADGGSNYVQLNSSYTVTDGNQNYSYVINSGQGNPYTNYWVVWTGTGTMAGSWQGYLLVR